METRTNQETISVKATGQKWTQTKQICYQAPGDLDVIDNLNEWIIWSTKKRRAQNQLDTSPKSNEPSGTTQVRWYLSTSTALKVRKPKDTTVTRKCHPYFKQTLTSSRMNFSTQVIPELGNNTNMVSGAWSSHHDKFPLSWENKLCFGAHTLRYSNVAMGNPRTKWRFQWEIYKWRAFHYHVSLPEGISWPMGMVIWWLYGGFIWWFYIMVIWWLYICLMNVSCILYIYVCKYT